MYNPSPEAFAASFNETYLGSYRSITGKEVMICRECEIIGRYGFYIKDDAKTIRGILKYEQIREKMPVQRHSERVHEPAKCRRCGQILHPEPGKPGRPREYCTECESQRSKDRKEKSRNSKGNLASIRN